jgi:hypothetical protein
LKALSLRLSRNERGSPLQFRPVSVPRFSNAANKNHSRVWLSPKSTQQYSTVSTSQSSTVVDLMLQSMEGSSDKLDTPVVDLMLWSMDPWCVPPGPFEMCAPPGPFEMCVPPGPFEMCVPPGPFEMCASPGPFEMCASSCSK